MCAALIEACYTGHVHVAKWIIEYMVDNVGSIIDKNRLNSTVLYHAVASTKTGGFTRLHSACLRGEASEVGRLLSQCGDSVNVQNICGKTPLHVACTQSNLEIVDILLSVGTDVIITNENKLTP